MKDRTLATLACLSALLLGTASTPALAQTKTLRVVAHADVKILDPTFTTAYITRNFGYMVYDMLFGRDDKGVPRPQMVEKYSTSKDGKEWSFTLRSGLKFSDGSPVSATDAVASIQRWAGKDSIGRAMAASGPEWKVVNATTFTLTFRFPAGDHARAPGQAADHNAHDGSAGLRPLCLQAR
jgi:peptide/nickel transport system substrate-binding protein